MVLKLRKQKMAPSECYTVYHIIRLLMLMH